MKSRPFIIFLLATLLVVPGFAAGSGLPDVWTARRAIEFARQNNPDSQLAVQRMRQAEATLQKAGVGFYPRVEVFGSYTQTNNPMYSFGNILNQGEFTPVIDFNDPGRTDSLGVGVGVSYRFYNGGQDTAHKQAAMAGVDVSSAERDAILLQLEFQIFQAFQRIVESRQMIQAREKALQAISSSLAVARARYDAGDLLRQDLLNLEVEQSRATENMVQAQNTLDISKHILLTLLGLPGDAVQIEVEDDASPVLPNDPDPLQRPELKQLDAALQAAESSLKAAQGSRLPTVDGFARYSYDQGTILDGSGDSWMAGVKLNFKVFDGYQSSSEIALSEAQLGALRAEQKKLELAFGLEVSQAKLALELARQRQQVTQKMVEQADESESLTKARFDAGVLMVSELIDSQNRLTDARVRQVLADSAVRIAIADLRRAAGLPQFSEHVHTIKNMEKQP